MPQQFILNGNVLFSDDNDLLSGGKVIVFDRDLPSLEKRGLAPQPMGEAALDDNAGFRIVYDEERFRNGEAAGPDRRRPAKIGADLSFEVLNSQGLALEIIKVVANQRVYHPEEIIFNAPPELRVENYVRPLDEQGLSEYEFLIELLAPVASGIPFAELSLEELDIAFLELGFDGDVVANTNGRIQDPDLDKQCSIWLVRSAQLSQQTGVDAGAFYGWGRKNLPANLEELSRIPQERVLELAARLASASDQDLREKFLAAVAKKIIPDLLRVKIDQLLRQLKRVGQVRREVVARLVD